MSHLHLTPPTTPPDRLQALPTSVVDRLEAALRAETATPPGWRGRLQALPTSVRVPVAVLGVACVAAVVVGATHAGPGLRPDLTEATPGLARGWLLNALLLFSALPLVLRPLDRPLDPGRRLSAGLLLLVAGAGLAGWPGAWPGSQAAAPWTTHAGCGVFSTVTALAATAIPLALDRSLRPTPDRVLAASAAGAAVSLLVLTLSCPHATTGHMLVAHGLAGAYVAALLTGLLAWWTRVRTTP